MHTSQILNPLSHNRNTGKLDFFFSRNKASSEKPSPLRPYGTFRSPDHWQYKNQGVDPINLYNPLSHSFMISVDVIQKGARGFSSYILKKKKKIYARTTQRILCEIFKNLHQGLKVTPVSTNSPSVV